MVFPELRERLGVALANGAEEVLRLVLELIQVGTDGQVTIGHDEPARYGCSFRWSTLPITADTDTDYGRGAAATLS